MIITLKGANFASSNIGTLDSWLISKSLTGVTIDNTATSVKKGEAYKAVITLKENYTFPDAITVTMGGTDITSTYVTKTATTITINVPSVTGNIVIRVNATSNVVGVTYSITRTLTALTSDSSVNTIASGDTYEEIFSIPKDMYDGFAGASGVEVDLTVKMGGSVLEPNTGAFTAELVYQQVSGVERATGFKVTVPNVSGNIAITATSYVPFNESIENSKVYHYTENDKSIDIDGVSIGDILIYASESGAKVHGWKIPASAKLTVTYNNTQALLSSEAMVLLHKTSNNVLDYKSTYIAAVGIGNTSTYTFTNVYNDEVLLEANEGVIVSGRYTVVGGGIEPDVPGDSSGQITTTYDLASFVNVNSGQLATNTNTWVHSDFIPVSDLSNSTEDGKCVRTFVSHGSVAAIAFYSQPDFNSYVEGFILSNTAAAGATAQTAEQVKACITKANANYVVFSTDGSKATLSVTTGKGSTVTPEPGDPENPSTGTSGINYYEEPGYVAASNGQITNTSSTWIHSDFIKISDLQDDATLGHCIGKFTGHSQVADIAFYSSNNFTSFIAGKTSAGATKTVAELQDLMTGLNATNATYIVISTDKSKNQLYANLK